MEMEVTITPALIEVNCQVPVRNDCFTFALASNLTISEMTNNTLAVKTMEMSDCSMQFRPPMTRYTVQGLKPGMFRFRYFGVPSGDFAFFTEPFIHFSYYNGWYPCGFDVFEEYQVQIKISDQYEVLRSVFHPDQKLWTHFAGHEAYTDCNIICIHKELSYSLKSDSVHAYWFDQEKDRYVKEIFHAYTDICRYYQELYGNDKTGCTDIVFTPGDYKRGAYKRDGLIVFSNLDKDPAALLHTLAHEIAHAYASGADVNSYHDWLNETHAEWSALLYAAEKKPETFHARMEQFLSDAHTEKNRLSLRECGDERPQNVHKTGTIIYYDIFHQFGKEAVAELLRIFDRLEEKNTDRFLKEAAKYNSDIAAILRSHL